MVRIQVFLLSDSSGSPVYLKFALLLCLSDCPGMLLNAYRFIYLFGSVLIISLSWYTIRNFPGLLEHDNCSCWIEIVLCNQGSLFPPAWTRVIPLCNALLWQSHTEPITAETMMPSHQTGKILKLKHRNQLLTPLRRKDILKFRKTWFVVSTHMVNPIKS